MSGVKLEPGEIFAKRYEIRRLLGEGDRKRTYLARDIKMDRLVAISFVKPDAVLADPDGTKREAQVLGRIRSHPNIVSLYDYEVDAERGVEYMIFEYLANDTLAEYLRDHGQLSRDDILLLGRQLCRGLAHLHGRGLVHRDVSPDNIWLDERNVAHLGDFDSAITATSSGERRPLTTNSFAAPEERDGRSVDVRADLYSLGGVLHVVATGERWPGGQNALRTLRPDLPSAFGDLIACLLAESRDERPLDAESVLRRLDEVRHASNIEALIAAGESDRVEFKSSLLHRHGPLSLDLQIQVDRHILDLARAESELRKSLKHEITKTVAAFLNTDGGTLLIGVSDSGSVLGIEHDLKYLKKDKQNLDGWLLALRDAIVAALGQDVWGTLRVSLVRDQHGTVAVVSCPGRATETWHRDGNAESFFIRAANSTQRLDGPSLIKYVRERWPG